MATWDDVIREALGALDADKVMVPGAKLRQKVEEVATRVGFDAGDYIARSGNPFSRLVAAVDGVRILPRPGSDLLVGFDSAQPPSPSVSSDAPPLSGGALRRDVYEAFTQLSRVGYVYQTGNDRFVPSDEAEGPALPVPEVTLDALIQDRQSFAESLGDDLKRPLIDALRLSDRPLADFRRALSEQKLMGAWASFQARLIRERVLTWARANNVTPREAWLNSEIRHDTAHASFQRLMPFMTSDEIRALPIPFRAVEAMLASLQPR